MVKTELSDKVSSIYGQGIIVDKSLSSMSDQFRKLPKFVVDYLISTIVDPDDPGPGLERISLLMRDHFVTSEQKEWIKSCIKENGQHPLIGNIICRYDQSKDEYWCDIDALGDQFVRIDPHIIAEYGDALLTTGAWGTITVAFDEDFKIRSKLYPFVVIDFMPFQITRIDLDEWIASRTHFTDDEWTDLMISSVGFNPDKLSEEEKMLYFMRLLPFVESNVNLVELGPPETGKTFNYRSLSSYGFVVSGSKTTIASLFYNKLRRKLGVVGYKDCVMFDEISHANWNGDDEMVSMLKDFMNTGRFGRDTAEFASDCSVVFAGNIDCDRSTKEVKGWHKHLFSTLPQLVRNDRAFLDRIHGYIPGWRIPQIAEANFATGFGFMADYLSEIMHKMRDRNYTHIVVDRVDFGEMTQRNMTAVTRIASGLIKLIYPHRTIDTIEDSEIVRVVDAAVVLRQRVVDQLAKIAPAEFGGVKLEYKLK